MMVRVVISRATLVPATSFSLSTLFRHPTTYLGPLLAFTMTACNTAFLLPPAEQTRARCLLVQRHSLQCGNQLALGPLLALKIVRKLLQGLTALLIELPQDLSNDLSYAL